MQKLEKVVISKPHKAKAKIEKYFKPHGLIKVQNRDKDKNRGRDCSIVQTAKWIMECPTNLFRSKKNGSGRVIIRI